jgi:hypothetical protein
MSCVKCDETEPVETYIRVGASNVMIVGCREHLAELIRIFRLGLEQDKLKGEK